MEPIFHFQDNCVATLLWEFHNIRPGSPHYNTMEVGFFPAALAQARSYMLANKHRYTKEEYDYVIGATEPVEYISSSISEPDNSDIMKKLETIELQLDALKQDLLEASRQRKPIAKTALRPHRDWLEVSLYADGKSAIGQHQD